MTHQQQMTSNENPDVFFFNCQKKIESITSTKLDEAMVINSILEIPHVEFNMLCQKLPSLKQNAGVCSWANRELDFLF